MEFKIDTKDTFSIITPVSDEINAKMTGALSQKCVEMRQSGRGNLIIDMQSCKTMDKTARRELVQLHEASYGADHSLVFTGMNDKIMEVLKDDETDLLINIAPRMSEAVDIISMEILERDLFKEE